MGVIWMGSGEETTAVIDSPECGIILRGSALDQWERNPKNGLQGKSHKHPDGKIDTNIGVPACQQSWRNSNGGGHRRTAC